ncbi:MAG: WG repeat-containing protein, partial [Alistipes sp.]
MMPTIYSFTQALLAPAGCFSVLHDLRTQLDERQLPRMSRSARFAEAEVEWQGASWLLCMPLTSAAIPAMERIVSHLRTLRSEWLADYRLLRNELRYEDSTGAVHHSDVVMQHLPAGCTFTQAVASVESHTLLAALDALEGEFARLDLSHLNLKAKNLRWSNHRFIPIRYHYTRIGKGNDTEAFERLRNEIRRGTDQPQQILHDVLTPYNTPSDRLTGHRWVSHVFEQLICVEDATGYGYVDTANHTVIPSQYLWAEDFHEGRAAVETPQGMGLID